MKKYCVEMQKNPPSIYFAFNVARRKYVLIPILLVEFAE